MTHGDDLSPFQQWYQDQQANKDNDTSFGKVVQDHTRPTNNQKDGDEPRKREDAEVKEREGLNKEYEETRGENEERRRDQLGPGCWRPTYKQDRFALQQPQMNALFYAGLYLAGSVNQDLLLFINTHL
jgi:hypothetical protein